MTLHPEADAYLRMVAAYTEENGILPPRQMGVERLRLATRERILALRPPLPAHASEDRLIPARSGPMAVRLIRPMDVGDDPLPVIVYFHGGGYVFGGIEESMHEAVRLAVSTPALVISADYRKGPEAPFPAAVEDGYDALVWAFTNAERFGGDGSRLMVGGVSAGGGLSAAVSRLAVVSHGPKIALNYLLCPWLDLTLSEPSVTVFRHGYGLDEEDLRWFAESYIGTGDPADPLASPALAEPPPNLPPTAIVAAECDPLVGEARRYADRLTEVGVPVTFNVAEGMVHAFSMILHHVPAGQRHLEPLEAALRRV